ncbi:hypothetical protein LEL_01206 [Akanthomyces lecanii RCEF 1005]|uniref:Uncharacterized protein n=1 Tax=Akanthomyces lecanii RCEF 1005 TaxID=1081108 RepID=A0A168KGK1_CORDF|nr:hypothetical protein LEL_01206 [Akanthomyces lecanii RCEF 1005]
MLWMLWKSGQFNFDDELEAGAHLPRCGGLRRGVAVHLNPGMESLTEHQQSLRSCWKWCCHTPNSDRKSLRAATRTLGAFVPLRIQRVFLSAYSRNIEVFRAVADHEALRHGVKEIVWDNAQLNTHHVHSAGDLRNSINQNAIAAGHDCPLLVPWLDLDEEGARLVEETWRHSVWLANSFSDHRKLILDQQEVLDSAVDVVALSHGLARFPSLRRITLTPSAHGLFAGRPLYPTPVLREFSKHFGYPLPEIWFGVYETGLLRVHPWQDILLDALPSPPRRGFRVLMRTLAESEHHVAEFVMPTDLHRQGMTCAIFTRRSQEADDLAALLSTPGFRNLDLALFTGYGLPEDWDDLRMGSLRQLLAGAPQLEQFSFSCSTGPGSDQPAVLVQEIFPVAS